MYLIGYRLATVMPLCPNWLIVIQKQQEKRKRKEKKKKAHSLNTTLQTSSKSRLPNIPAV